MRILLGLAAATALLVSLAPVLAADGDVVATIGTQPVKAAEVKDFIDDLPPQQRELAMKDPRAMTQFVRSAVARRLLLEEVEKHGWEKKPDIAAQLARARREVLLATYLRSVAMPPATYPSDEELRTTYDKNRERFHQYHIAQIFVAEPPGSAPAAIEKKARDLGKKAKAKGADFAALARASSDDRTSAPKGGDLGWLPENQIQPAILGAVTALPEKGVSEPVHAAGGWHILMLLGAKLAEFAQVRDQLATILRDSKLNQNEQAYSEKLLADKHVTVDDAAAAALFGVKK
jgi:parvulin-like peptidyl-prolyl isomerase